MSATVAAALKKIAVAIASDPKALKKIGLAVLVIFVVVFLPVIVLLGLTSGDITIDTGRLKELVIESLSEDETGRLQALEDKMGEIHDVMVDTGFSSAQAKEAQVLYVMALYDHRDDEDFNQKLIYGFYQAQSDEQLISQINDQFGTQIKPEDFSNVMKNIREQQIAVVFDNPVTKNNLDLVKWAQYAVSDGWGYVWGTYGKVLTEESLWARTDQYPYQVGRFFSFIKTNWVGKRTADCIGLIKGYGWYNPDNGEIEYGTNGVPDTDATSLYSLASEKGPISTIPEIPGLAVWQTGHVGIYIGNGQVIQAAGTKQGVILSELQHTGFTHWLKIPFISYG